ncbi:MAG: hypothetical protein A3K75_05275 [Euryarchaeota archaeon RBG_13_61_15]|nr:MAG: hypothetical protein A3K75_05275 [Euryarchaeota archaeon RBG_13_61_15]
MLAIAFQRLERAEKTVLDPLRFHSGTPRPTETLPQERICVTILQFGTVFSALSAPHRPSEAETYDQQMHGARLGRGSH